MRIPEIIIKMKDRKYTGLDHLFLIELLILVKKLTTALGVDDIINVIIEYVYYIVIFDGGSYAHAVCMEGDAPGHHVIRLVINAGF